MSEEKAEEVEQITKEPTVPVEKIKQKKKDPKKVKAGKRLAEQNKKAKEALKREMEREAEIESEKAEVEGRGSLFPELSFTTVVAFVGTVVGLVNLYYRFYPPKVQVQRPKVEEKSERAMEEPKSKIPVRVGMN